MGWCGVNNKKISIEEFKIFKDKLRNCQEKEEYFKLQEQLLSYDLSDIPWI